MNVYLLTNEQKELIVGKPFTKDSLFNPILDNNGNFVISVEEVEQCDNEEFSWVKTLPLIPFEPIPVPPVPAP